MRKVTQTSRINTFQRWLCHVGGEKRAAPTVIKLNCQTDAEATMTMVNFVYLTTMSKHRGNRCVRFARETEKHEECLTWIFKHPSVAVCKRIRTSDGLLFSVSRRRISACNRALIQRERKDFILESYFSVCIMMWRCEYRSKVTPHCLHRSCYKWSLYRIAAGHEYKSHLALFLRTGYS